MSNQHSVVSKMRGIFKGSIYALVALMLILPLTFAALVCISIFVAVVLPAGMQPDESQKCTEINSAQNPTPAKDSTPSFILKTAEGPKSNSFEIEVRNSSFSVTTTIYLEISSCDTTEDLKMKIALKEGLSSLGSLCLFFCGRELQDGQSLLDQSVVPGSVVFLVNQKLVVQCDQTQRILILDFGWDDYVYNIKAKILDKTGLFPVEQSLFYAGKQIEDLEGLCNYHIRFGSILHWVLDQRPRDPREVLICTPNGRTITLNTPLWTSILDLKKLLGRIVGLETHFQSLSLRGISTRLPDVMTLEDIEEDNIEEEIGASPGPDNIFQFLISHNGRQYQSAAIPHSGPESQWGLERGAEAPVSFVSLSKIHPPSNKFEQEHVNREGPLGIAHSIPEVEWPKLNNASGEITCQISHCGGKFKTRAHYSRHMRYHDKPQQCPWAQCDASWSTKKDLDRHINSVHHTTTVHYCSIEGCTKYFPRKDNLKRHEEKCHKRHVMLGYEQG